MPKLYELTQNYKNLLDLADDETIDTAIIETALKTIESSIQEKAQNLAIIIKSVGADAEIIKAEEKRLAAKRKALENKQTWLKDYLQNQLEFVKLEKVKTAVFTVALQNNPASVQILDETVIPAQFKTIIPATFSIDKEAIKDAIKRGALVPGVELITDKRHLRIR